MGHPTVHSLVLALTLLILLGVGESSAASVTWTFSGQISAIFADPGDAALLAGAGVAPGAAFAGSVTFDTGVTDRDSSPTFGLYLGAISAFNVAIGASFATGPSLGNLFINAGRAPTSPNIYVALVQIVDSAFLTSANVQFAFLDSDADVIADDSLLLQPPDLSLLDPHDPNDAFRLGLVNGMQISAFGASGGLVEITWEFLEIVAEPGPNEPPECSGAAAALGEVWPPNHEFHEVSIEGVADPDGDPIAITITGIFQDERLDDPGSGNTCPDAAGVGTDRALLRGERNGGSDGRIYYVSFRAKDGQGGQCTATVAVCHPHDQGQGDECIDQGPLFDSTGPCDASNDADGDGLLDSEEAAIGTHVLNPDSDGDGFSDAEELAAGSDPKSQTSTPGGSAQPTAVPTLSTWGPLLLAGLVIGAALVLVTRVTHPVYWLDPGDPR